MNKRERKAIERKFMQVAMIAMSSEEPVLMQMTVKDIWMVVSSLQYTLTDPNISPVTKMWFRSICDFFITVVSEEIPAAREVLEMGYDAKYHVTYKDGQPMEDEE